MALVGGLIGNADGEKGDHRGDQVEAGVQRFGQNAQAAGAKDEKRLERHEHDGGAHAEQRGALLFAHFDREGLDHEQPRLPQVQRLCLAAHRAGPTIGSDPASGRDYGVEVLLELRGMKRSAAEFMQ